MTSESRPKQRTVVIVQARMGSTRLPGKVLKELSGRPMLTHLLQRLGECRNVDDVWVATTWAPDDDAIVTTAAEAGAGVWRGPEEDTLSRYLGAAEAAGADVVVRVTGDCPLIEPGVIDAAVALRRDEHVDYVSAGSSSKLPRGLDCEVFTRTALATAATVDMDPASREHVTLAIFHRPELFDTLLWPAPAELQRPHWRLCVDEPADFELVEKIYERLWNPDEIIRFEQVAALLEAEPELAAINAEVKQRAYPGQERPGPRLHSALSSGQG
jgi:spore coat polysaccharide biosynthesis protein SpsF